MLIFSSTIFNFIAELEFKENKNWISGKVYIKVNMTIGKLDYESESSWILLKKQTLRKKTEVSRFEHFYLERLSKIHEIYNYLNFSNPWEEPRKPINLDIRDVLQDRRGTDARKHINTPFPIRSRSNKICVQIR